MMKEKKKMKKWIDMEKESIEFKGMKERIWWVGIGDRKRIGIELKEMVRKGELKEKIVIGRENIDRG